MISKRGFSKISFKQYQKDFANIDITEEHYNDLIIPSRATKKAAGYDFYAPMSFNLKPGEIIKIPTGIRAYMQDDEFLAIILRSSIGFKYNVRLCNQMGIIDADYYNNDKNEGHIFVALQNEGSEVWKVKKRERFAQGIFLKYFITDDEKDNLMERKGGIGSTGKGGVN
ncbi:MAG: deoxyuridine 5'-triphosphate nucleotidohydrolase [Bacilli bacterium]|nr:deoxyuridine 5'-triphosphate nucleotidohydrolase [Bacilli bacterium]